MTINKFRIRIYKIGDRLRARLEDKEGKIEFGEWWVESSNHKRYKPFKPMHPMALAIISKLPLQEQEKIAWFLLTAEDGDTYEFTLPS